MPERPLSTTDAARQLASALGAQGQDYALGGAIALGYWSEPRGTMDVDLTIFLPPEKPAECVWCLQEIGCEVDTAQALESLRQHGFCRTSYKGVRVDVFLPTTPFYETARRKREMVLLGDQLVAVWDATCLSVFKMMFFRRKDIADIEQMLRVQSANFDRAWVREQLVEIFGRRDPRIAQWDELVSELSQ